MRRTFLITIAFFFLLVASCIIGCRKKATKINPEYVGNWARCWSKVNATCNDGCHVSQSIRIDEKSQGECFTTDETTKLQYREGIARIRDGELSIGLRKKFSIDQPPTALDSLECHWGSDSYAWYMILSGDTYYKE